MNNGISSFLSRFVQYFEPWQFSFVFVFLQIGVLVGLAWLVYRRLDRSPKDQHFIWLAVLFAIACAVPLQLLVPGWAFEVERVVSSESTNSLDEMRVDSIPGHQLQNEIGAPETITSPILPDEFANLNAAEGTPAFEDSPTDTEQDAAAMPTLKGLSNASASWALPSWKTILKAVYFLVFGWILTRLLFGWALLRSIRGKLPESDELKQLVTEVSMQLGLKTNPRLLVSPKTDTPLTFGIFQPTVLLPEEFLEWNRECQRVVLAHEFCHIQRRDAVWDLLARLISAAWWFHPAVHFANRLLRRTRETATDLAVLELGIAPTSYARELLNVTAGTNDLRSSLCCSTPALPMAGEQDFETRIKRILRSPLADNKKRSLRKSMALHGVLLTAFLLLICNSLQMTIANILPQEEEIGSTAFLDEVDDDKVAGNDFYTRVSQTQVRKRSTSASPFKVQRIDISGVVQGPNSEPVAGAIVIIRNGFIMHPWGDKKINWLIAKTRTDDQGHYEFKDANLIDGYSRPEIVAFATTGEMGWAQILTSELRTTKVFTKDIKLIETVPLTGQLVHGGEPVANATLTLESFARQTESDRVAYIRYNGRVIAPSTVTDENGKFEFPAVPKTHVATVRVQHPDYAYDSLQIRASESHQDWLTDSRRERITLLDNGEKFEIEKGVVIGGKVVDGNGAPLGNVTIAIGGRYVESDAEGKFQALTKESRLQNEEYRLISNYLNLNVVQMVSTSDLRKLATTIVRETPIELTGKILDSDSKEPITDAVVDIVSSGGISAIVPTNNEGVYTKLVVPGELTIRLVKPGAGYEFPTPRNNTNSERDLVHSSTLTKSDNKLVVEPLLLQRSKTVEVLVVDEKGTPVEDAEVSLWSPKEHGTCKQHAPAETTLQNGICELVGLSRTSDGSFVVARAKIGEQEFMCEETLTQEMLAQENSPMKVTLLPAATVSGKATLNGKPLPGIEIKVTGNSQTKPTKRGRFTALRVVGSRTIGKTTTDKNGEYSIPVPRTSRFGIAGNYMVGTGKGIPNPKASGIHMRTAVDEHGEYTHNIEFVEGTAQISGTVVDSDGNPVEGVFITIARPRSGPSDKTISPYRYWQASVVYSDHEGKFTITGLPKGNELEFRSGVDPNRRGEPEKYIDKGKSRFKAKPGDNDIKIELTLKEN